MLHSDEHWKWVASSELGAAPPATAPVPSQPQVRGKAVMTAAAPAAPPTLPSWRQQMHAIVRLRDFAAPPRVPVPPPKTPGDVAAAAAPTVRDDAPTWIAAVANALRARDPCAQMQQWELAADAGGNAVAGVEFARLVLFDGGSVDDVARACAAGEEDDLDVLAALDAKQQKALQLLDAGCAAGLPSAMVLVSRLLRGDQVIGRSAAASPATATATTTAHRRVPTPPNAPLVSYVMEIDDDDEDDESRSRVPPPRAQRQLPILLPANLLLSRRWLEKAASLDYAPALHELGELFERGVVDPQKSQKDGSDASVYPRNLVASMRCFKRAADLGFTQSLLSLGRLFLLADPREVAAESRPHQPQQQQQQQQQQSSYETVARAEHFLQRALQAGCLEAAPLLEHAKKLRAELQGSA